MRKHVLIFCLLLQSLCAAGASRAWQQTAAPAASPAPIALPDSATLRPVLQQGHSGGITQAVFASGDTRLATASLDGTARLWDLKSGVLSQVFAPGAPIARMALARNGRTLVTYGAGVLCFWNAENARLLARVLVTPNVASLNATAVVIGAETVTAYGPRGQTRVWDSMTGSLRNTYDWKPEDLQKRGRPLALTPDGNFVLFQREEVENADTNDNNAGAFVGPDGKIVSPPKRYKLVTLELVDARTGVPKAQLQPFEQRADQGYNPRTVFSPDGAIMAQAGDDGLVHVWNVAARRALPLLRVGKLPANFLTFSPDGKRLATASRQANKETPGDVIVWDVQTGKRVVTLPGLPDIAVHALAFDPTGQTLAVSAPNWHDRKLSLQLWNIVTGKPRLAMPGGTDVDTLAFAPDGALLIGNDPEGGLRVWNAQTGQTVAAFAAARQAFSPLCSPDGLRLVYAGYNGWLHVWDAATARLIDSFPANKDFGPDARYLQTEAVFAPDGRSLAYVVPRKGSAEIYDLAGHARRELFPADPKGVVSAQRLLFAPDGKTLALSASDGKTRFLDAQSGSVLTTLDYTFSNFIGEIGTGERGAAFTPDGRSFVGLNNSSIQIYNVADGALRATISPGRFQDGVRLTADGSLLAAMLDREVQLYDVATGQIKASLRVTDGEYLFSVLLSPDGRQVLTRGSQRLRVWDVASGQTVATLQTPPPADDVVYPYYGVSPVIAGFSGDGKMVGLRLPSNQTVVWEASSGRLLTDVTPAMLAGFAPALRRPLSVSGASLVLHDPHAGRPIAFLTAFPALTFAQQAPAAAPDVPRPPAAAWAWLAQTPDGYFDGSPDIARFLWAGGTSAPSDTADARIAAFHRPDQVQKTLRLERIVQPGSL